MSNSNEIAQIEEINKALTNLNGTLDQTSAKYLSIVKNINDSNASVKISIQTQENLNKAQKDAADTTKQLDSLGKQLEASERKLKETEDSRLQTIIENRIATQEATKAIKDKVIANQVEEGSLVRMRQQLSELTKAYDQSGTRTKAAADEINRLSTEIGKAETATNRHQRAVGGYKEAIGEVGSKFLGFAGMIGIAITLVNQLTEAFKATDIGVRFFSKMSEAAKTFFNNVINGMPGIAVMNSYLATQIAGKLDDLRVEERGEAIRVANLNTDVKLLRLKAATTKDLTVQMDLYRQADAKENESIAIRKEHLTAEIEQLGNMAAVRQKDSALLDKLSQKQVELVELAGDKNIRIQTKLAADQDKLDQQKIKAAEKAAKDRADAIEAENSKQVSMINQSYIDGKISDERYASELTMQEKIYLTSKLALYKQGSKEYMDLIVQMQNLEIKSIEEHNKSKLKLDKDQQNAHDAMEDENLVTIEKNANASIKINKDKRYSDQT